MTIRQIAIYDEQNKRLTRAELLALLLDALFIESIYAEGVPDDVAEITILAQLNAEQLDVIDAHPKRGSGKSCKPYRPESYRMMRVER